MKNKKKHGQISTSLMCAGLVRLPEYLQIFKEENIEYLHIDVMDGHFVPNLCLGTDYISEIRKMSDIPLDIHLMISKPEDKLEWFGLIETDTVAIHYESTHHAQQVLEMIKTKYGCRALLALNPATAFWVVEDLLDYVDGIQVMTVNPGFAGRHLVKSTVSKVERLRKFLNDSGCGELPISVDGNMSFENAKIMRDKGADIFVAGSSSIFKEGEDTKTLIKNFRESIA